VSRKKEVQQKEKILRKSRFVNHKGLKAYLVEHHRGGRGDSENDGLHRKTDARTTTGERRDPKGSV